MEFSCSLQIGDLLPWERVLPAMADAGCRGVDLPATDRRGAYRLTDPEDAGRLARELRDHGMTVDWVHAPYRWPMLYHEGDARRSLSLAAQLHWLGVAARLGARVQVFHPFFAPEFPRPDPDGAIERLRDSFAVLTREGRRLGILVAIENLQNPLNNGYAERLLAELPELSFCLDAGHSHLNGDGERWLPRYGGRLVATHLHDNHGVGVDEHLPPGQGVVDWREWAGRLVEAGYDGVWGMEIHPPDGGEDARKVTAALREAMGLLREAARSAKEAMEKR